jgi:hypothetical protein
MNPTEYKEGKLSSIRNPDGWWINVEPFREEGNHFKKYGYYCADPWGSPSWYEYWTEQRNRCIHGYSVGGVKITGDHYFYMNFCPIKKVEDTTKKISKKIKGFPDFWDGDYNYFWVREIARYGILEPLVEGEEEKQAILQLPSAQQAVELKQLFESLGLMVKIKVDHLSGGFNLIVGKSRRKGYSYKAAAVGSRAYFTKPNSLIIFGAYEKKYLYPQGIFTMLKSNIDFINENTGWAMPSDVIDKQDHKKASYIEYVNGLKLEKGFKSEVVAYTFKDNPDAARGKDAEEIFFEESGAFGTPGLLQKSYASSLDCVMAGDIQTGLITIFGTSGDMEGGTYDYADMHSRPAAFGLLPFDNIWDEGMQDVSCGFFHPIQWNMEGHYDANGNSDTKSAMSAEKIARENLIKNGATSVEIQNRMQEKPFGPGEAFTAVSVNTFPVVELKNQLRKVRGNNWQQVKGTMVNLVRNEGEVQGIPILDNSTVAITSFHNVPLNKRGCPVIYEAPIPNPPRGLYKIGYDPIRQDEGTSLAAIIVYKGAHAGSLYHSMIVAEYIGRRDDPEDIDRIAELLADYYNAQIMYENEVTGVKNYFRKIKRLNLLAAQPDKVISKNIKNSRVARVYGCHMNKQLRDATERYIKSWLQTTMDFDEHGNPVTVIDKIYSVRLLEELINYNRNGNFDLVDALGMALVQQEEETLGKVYEAEPKRKAKVVRLLELSEKMYQKK